MTLHIIKRLTAAACGLALAAAAPCAVWAAAPAPKAVSLNLFYGGTAHAYAHEALAVTVCGAVYDDVPLPALMLGDTAFISAQYGFKAGGAVYAANKQTSAYSITYGGNTLAVRPDTVQAALNGKELAFDPPPLMVNNILMVPLIPTANVLGIPVTVTDSGGTVFSASAFADYAKTHQTLQEAPPAPPGTPDVAGSPDDAAAARTGPPTLPLADDPLFSLSNTAPLMKLVTDVSSQKLTASKLPEAAVTGITTASDSQKTSFVIQADAAISAVNRSMVNNNLAIDIDNARSELPDKYPSPVPAITEVGCSQTAYKSAPSVNIVRVLFVTAGPVSYSVAMSADRKSVTVSFMKDKLKNIGFRSSGGYDYIYIQTGGATAAGVRNGDDADKSYIDIKNVGVAYPLDTAVDGALISAYALTQDGKGGVSIALTEKTPARADVNQKGNMAVVRFSPADQNPGAALPVLKNISYDGAGKRIVIKKDPTYPVSLSAVTPADNYTKLQYVFSFPGDCTPLLGGGTQVVSGAGPVRTVNVRYNERTGRTDLTIGETAVYAYNMTEDSGNIYITAINPKSVYQRIVILDPGHGDTDQGASRGAVLEKDLNLDICLKAAALLEGSGVKAYLTRTDDSYPTLNARVDMANALGDLFISVHINASPKGPGSDPAGTGTYYDPHSNDSKAGITTKQVAQIIQNRVVMALGSADNGIDTQSFQVTRTTTIPSALCEIGFITNDAEFAKLTAAAYQQKAAQGIYNAIMDIFKIYKPAR